MKVYFKSKIGARRTNEDRHTIILNSSGENKEIQPIDMLGVYDGHGGSHISTILSNIIPKLFLDKRITYPLHKNQVNKLYGNVQKILTENFNDKAKECGSTCLIVLKIKNDNCTYLNIINVGDSRSVLCSGTTAVQLTMDHKPLHPYEKKRIMNQGGNVYYDGNDWRVDNLSVSRAFGDITSLYTTPIPDVFQHKITKNDKFIILACDGLWDVVDNQSAVNFVLHFCYDTYGKRINEKFDIAKRLVDYAIAQGSGDNVSVIVAFFD
jgi:serine/threonine protein phosphatase PrpC